MKEYIKLFQNYTLYETYKNSVDYVTPNVSYCEQLDEVHYNPFVPPFFCKLTFNNGSTVELEGSGELTRAMVSEYKSTVINAEIGELCTSIGNAVFNSCSSLTSVTIPDSVTSIGISAFAGCIGLASVTMGSGVTRIGQAAFVNCSNLTTITSYIMNAPSVVGGTFGGVGNGGTLYVPIGSSGYETWMNDQGNLGQYGWTKVEQ